MMAIDRAILITFVGAIMTIIINFKYNRGKGRDSIWELGILLSLVLLIFCGILIANRGNVLAKDPDYACAQSAENLNCTLINKTCTEYHEDIFCVPDEHGVCDTTNTNTASLCMKWDYDYRFKTDCELNPRYDDTCWGAQYFDDAFEQKTICTTWNGTTEMIVYNTSDSWWNITEIMNATYDGEFNEHTPIDLAGGYRDIEIQEENETFRVYYDIDTQEETEESLAAFYPGTILAEPNKNLNYTWMKSSISYEDELTNESLRVELNFEANKCMVAEKVWVRR